MSSRKRLSSEESRAAALEAARNLLIDEGPQSVTLKAVAARVNRTHANLLHHFGTAAGLQRSLAIYLAQSVCGEITAAVRATQKGTGCPREVVDLTFDALGKHGGGALAGWLITSGHQDALRPFVAAVQEKLDEVMPADLTSEQRRERREVTLSLVLLALGDALMGEALSDSLQVERVSARGQAEKMISFAFERYR